MLNKTNKDVILTLLFITSLILLGIYSWLTNNFLAKTFILGLKGCEMLTALLLHKLLM